MLFWNAADAIYLTVIPSIADGMLNTDSRVPAGASPLKERTPSPGDFCTPSRAGAGSPTSTIS